MPTSKKPHSHMLLKESNHRLEAAPSLVLRRTKALFRRHCGQRMSRKKILVDVECMECSHTETIVDEPLVLHCEACGHIDRLEPSAGDEP